MRNQSNSNVIGGTATGARNVFAGGAETTGVSFDGRANGGNTVQGNYFGCNASGTSQRPIQEGVSIWAEAQTIGGRRAKAGNCFTPESIHPAYGVRVYQEGSGSVVQHNTFGKLPNGQFAPAPMEVGVQCLNATIDVLGNTFAKANHGIAVDGAAANPRVFRNSFSRCDTAVWIQPDARCRMGNLGNSWSGDDGGNVFRSTKTWHVRNESAYASKAEGNDFGTTSKAAIDAKIWDRRDDPSLGRVDFIPLMGHVIPTGLDAPALALTGTTAWTTKAGGAEIVFSLSAPAEVTVEVLNIAGRPVATVSCEAGMQAGTQRLIWSGQTHHGTAAPAGAYLVRVAARDAGGQQVQALSVLRLQR